MKHISQASRRSFLSSLAILSAGAAFGSVTDLFTGEGSAANLQQQWRSFCTQNGGQLLAQDSHFETKTVPLPCSGHSHQTGQLIHFEKNNLLAQPTWIYWGQEKSKPADVIVTFFKNDSEMTKLFRINRFEMAGLCALSDRDPGSNLVAMLKLAQAARPTLEPGNKALAIKTRIRQGKRAHILATLPEKQVTIEKTITYNT